MDELKTPNTKTLEYYAAILGLGEVPDNPQTPAEEYLKVIAEQGGGGGTTNYNQLNNKPKINGKTISGEEAAAAYSLQNKLVAGDGISIDDNGDNTATISVVGGGDSEVFICTYGVTTHAELLDAYNAKKVILYRDTTNGNIFSTNTTMLGTDPNQTLSVRVIKRNVLTGYQLSSSNAWSTIVFSTYLDTLVATENQTSASDIITAWRENKTIVIRSGSSTNTIVQQVVSASGSRCELLTFYYSAGKLYRRIYTVDSYRWTYAQVEIGGGSVDAYTKAETDALLDDKSSFEMASISTAGGGEEVHATLSQGNDTANINYYKDSELPNALNLNIGDDGFRIPTTGYVDTETAKKGNAKITFDREYQYLQIRDDNGTDIGFSQETADTVRIQEYAKDSRGQVQNIFDETLVSKAYVDTEVEKKQKQLSYNDDLTYTASDVKAGSTTVDAIIPDVSYFNGKLGQNIEVGKEKWYGTYTDENGETFQVYSKMVYIPALPATAGITTYEHGVSNIKQILSIYGFTADGFVLNAPRQNAQDNIAIYQASKSASNQTFSIEVGKDRSSKKAYVVMVYAKNN